MKINSIAFNNFHVRFKDDILKAVNLRINRGDRIVLTGSRRGGKVVAVDSMLGIFEDKHVEGDIELNDELQLYHGRVPR